MSSPLRSVRSLSFLVTAAPSRVKNLTVKVRPTLAPLRTTSPSFSVAIEPPLISAAPV